MHELFIYYRAKVLDEAALLADVQAMQRDLQVRFPGLQARLLRRPEAADGLHTWMETYALPRASHGTSLDGPVRNAIEAAASAALGRWIAGVRHVEVFRPCA